MIATLNKIISRGVKIFQRSLDDQLIFRARRGDLQEVRRLLANKQINVNAKDYYYGQTALHKAAMYGVVELVQELLQKGANLNAKDDYGNTPLMLATVIRNEKIVRELLSQEGIEVNVKNNDGSTALTLAVNGRNIEIARLITSHIDPSGNIVVA